MSYIYIRDNEWYKQHNVYKIGITTSIKDRNSTYITGEIIRGEFIKIYELSDRNEEQLKIIDKLFKKKFLPLNKYHNGGTEFYDRILIDQIEIFLENLKIKYDIIDEKKLKRINKDKNIKDLTYLILKYINLKATPVTLNDYQIDVLNKIDDFYEKNNIGKLLWACGLGKTIMSLFITKHFNFNKILIGVSSCYLQTQFSEEIKKIYNNDCIIYLFDGNIEKINKLFNEKKEKIIFVITTYHSCCLLKSFEFDFKIGDECHHLVGKNEDENKKQFILFHKIKSNKSLFMTATEKIIINENSSSLYSMNNKELFGEIIDEKSFGWAITNKKITDYKTIIIKNNLNEIKNIIENIFTDSSILNPVLFIYVYVTLKSFTINYKDNQPLTHLLLYTNTIEDAKIASNYISFILNKNIIDINKDDIYYKDLHSQNTKDINNEIKIFSNSKYGIITCVQIFGEGINCIKLNGISIACNMFSNIKITQYISRPNRLNPAIKDKIAYYIIPYIDDETNKSLNNIRNIMNQLSLIDGNIEEKITVYNGLKSDKSTKIHDYQVHYISLNENIDELLKIKLYLKHTKDLKSDFTEEENEYNYIKNINKSLEIKSKKEYLEFKDKHQNYIDNPDIYFRNKGVWENWSDYLGYDTSLFIPTKEKWIVFCKEKNINTIEKYNEYSSIYKELPKDPDDFYRDFTNINEELKIKINNKRRF
uniref:Helicase ATP-binding domain-containing protein n=1 Tax=viral metagenome TaxID=1070528 RepID=A0A6C0CDT4_9ZZZZ